jgi:molybdopterin synthase catalytic subunit
MSALPTATVRVLLFASYAEWTGRESIELSLAAPATVADVVRHLRAAVPSASRIPERPLAAVNAVQVGLDAFISDGDEVALLPPLSGG